MEASIKKILLNILLSAIFFTLIPTGSLARSIKITDMSGRKVQVPFDPERIVCIGPGTLRLIVYLQAESKLAGVEDMEKNNPEGRPYWLAHPELANLPRCGPGGPASINKKPDLEAVLSVRPEVIFITYMDARLAQEVQKTLGLPVVVLSYGAFATFDEKVYKALELAGKILNREERAEEVIKFVQSQRKELSIRTSQVSQEKRPRAYIGGIGYRGAHGIESTEQNYAPLDWVGAKNLAQEVQASTNTHVFLDKEILLKLNPEYIFIDAGGLPLVQADFKKKEKYYRSLKAFSQNKVYILHPFNFYTTNIGTALADAWAAGKILYKKPFQDICPAEKANQIYTFLVGKPVYEKMKKEYGPIARKANF